MHIAVRLPDPLFFLGVLIFLGFTILKLLKHFGMFKLLMFFELSELSCR